MKISVKRKKGSMSISFRAGKNEGGDLARAVLASAKGEFSPAGIIEELKTQGYSDVTVEAREGLSLKATMQKAEPGAVSAPATDPKPALGRETPDASNHSEQPGAPSARRPSRARSKRKGL